MDVIRGVAPTGGLAGSTRQARATGGFRLPRPQPTAAGRASGVEAVGLAGMLVLQELPDRDGADR